MNYMVSFYFYTYAQWFYVSKENILGGELNCRTSPFWPSTNWNYRCMCLEGRPSTSPCSVQPRTLCQTSLWRWQWYLLSASQSLPWDQPQTWPHLALWPQVWVFLSLTLLGVLVYCSVLHAFLSSLLPGSRIIGHFSFLKSCRGTLRFSHLGVPGC